MFFGEIPIEELVLKDINLRIFLFIERHYFKKIFIEAC